MLLNVGHFYWHKWTTKQWKAHFAQEPRYFFSHFAQDQTAFPYVPIRISDEVEGFCMVLMSLVEWISRR
jgi:hypothetical protein